MARVFVVHGKTRHIGPNDDVFPTVLGVTLGVGYMQLWLLNGL